MVKRQKDASNVEHTEVVVKMEEHDDSWDLKVHSAGEDEDKDEDEKAVKDEDEDEGKKKQLKEEEKEIQLNRIEEEAAARRALRKMRNEKLKLKKESEQDFMNPLKAVEILSAIQPFAITIAEDDELDINQTVTRLHLSALCGGSPQATFPDMAPEKKAKLTSMGFSADQWQCITTDYNPYMPSIPGQPGLYFGSRRVNDDLSLNHQWSKGRCRVIGRIDSGRWLYLGHYEMSYSSTLTIDEWKGLPPKAKKTWIQGMLLKNWGRNHRIRIQLRNRSGANRQFTLAEYTARLNNTSNTYLGAVTAEQVADALDRGDEAIVVWKMTCVAYEQEFQRYIVKELEPTPKKDSKKRKASSDPELNGDDSSLPERMETRSSAKRKVKKIAT